MDLEIQTSNSAKIDDRVSRFKANENTAAFATTERRQHLAVGVSPQSTRNSNPSSHGVATADGIAVTTSWLNRFSIIRKPELTLGTKCCSGSAAKEVSLWILPALLTLLLHATAVAAEDYQAHDLVVVPIDFVEVPATRSGRMIEIKTRPGNEILRGEVVGAMDDRHAMLAIQLAESELQIAHQLSGSAATIDAAISRLEGEKQAARQLIVTRDIAKLKAKNNLRVLAAQKSEAVAANEYRRAADSRQQYAESVSKSEIDSLKLVVDKSRLESKQAEFERQIASLEVNAETEAARRQVLAIEQAEAEVSAAQTEIAVTKLQLQNRQIQLELAKAKLDDHRIIAPLDGRVTKIYKTPGAWATEGESIARIVRLDRLRLEGFAPVEQLHIFEVNAAIDVSVVVAGETVHRTGEIAFVDPEIDPVTGEFRFWIDFDNENMEVLPGMRASARIRQ